MASFELTRRALLGAALGLSASRFVSPAAAEIFTETSGLGAGRFIWQPRLARSGPVLILVTPAEQTLHVYRGAERIGISTCRITAPASAPLGVFSLIDQGRTTPAQSDDIRRSWRVAASHVEGLAKSTPAVLPIRLPRDFAGLLADATRTGATIAITPRRTVPQFITHRLGASDAMLAGIVQRAGRGPETDDAMGAEAHIVVSSATRTATVIRGGEVEAIAPVTIAEPDQPLGTYLYALNGAGDAGPRWLAVAMAQKADAAHFASDPQATLNRIAFEPGSACDEALSSIGNRTALLLTDTASAPATRRAAPGLEVFSTTDPQPAASPPKVADRPARRAHAPRRTATRTAEGSEPVEAPKPWRFFDMSY